VWFPPWGSSFQEGQWWVREIVIQCGEETHLLYHHVEDAAFCSGVHHVVGGETQTKETYAPQQDDGGR